MLLALGVPERAAMGIMGWSSTAMAARYQQVTDPIRQDIAQRVDGLLWATADESKPKAKKSKTKKGKARN
jgi:hypothetical protein